MKFIRNNIFCVAVLTLLLVTACKFGADSGSSSDSSNATGNSGVSAKPISSASDPREALAGAMKNLQQAPSWATDVVTSIDVAPQSDTKMEVEYLAPDKFHIESEAGGNQFEIILIGTDSYLLANGKWQKAPNAANMGQMINNWKQMSNPDSVAAFKNIEFAGEETVNNKQTLAYTYQIDPLAAMSDEARAKMPDAAKTQFAGMKNDMKIWIDAAKNLPVKLEMTTKSTQPKEMTMKLIYDYHYDREVKIEAPKLAASGR